MKEACKKQKRQGDDDDKDDDDDDDQDEDSIDLDDFNDNTVAITTTAAPLPEPEVVDRRLNNIGYRFFGHVRSLNPRTALSEEDGRKRCDDALRFSTAYDICSSRVDTSAIVESCALDVAVSWPISARVKNS